MLTETVCMALSAAGLAVALVTAWRRRYRAALRWAAVALLPTGLYLTGLITVLRKIGEAIGTWAAHLVFDPRVWVGIGMLGAAVVLLLLTGVRRGSAPRRASSPEARTAPLPVRAGRPGPPAVGGTGAAGGAGAAGAAGGSKSDDDMKEIEEILKRRGI